MRLALVTQGSGGDLFPVVGLASALEQLGHSCLVLAPVELCVPLRGNGVSVAAFGISDYPERKRRLASDPDLLSLRFGGLSAWLHVIRNYYAPYLQSHSREISAALVRFGPDHVFVHQLCLGGQLACDSNCLPWSSIDLYPQLLFGRGLPLSNWDGAPRSSHRRNRQRLVGIHRRVRPGKSMVEGTRNAADSQARSSVLLHERILLPTGVSDCYDSSIIGFPYWDHLHTQQTVADQVTDWLSSGHTRVLLTAGSFIGDHSAAWIDRIANLAWPSTWRIAITGITGELPHHASESVRVFDFAPLSLCGPAADIVVHHGGIGSSYGALSLGLPAVVIPRSFDQLDNGLWLSGLGVAETLDFARVELCRLPGTSSHRGRVRR